MKKVSIKNLLISGIKIRTNNQNEQNPNTAKIAKLWEDFYSQNVFSKIVNKKENANIYGVYSSYESDVNGDFDVIAGVEVSKCSGHFETINIQEAKFLVFEKSGSMPQAVIECWQEIWKYFQTSQEIRAYKIDFEKYINQECVQIYISIK